MKKHRPPSAHIFYKILLWTILLAFLAWLYFRLASLGFSYEWHWNRVWRHFGSWTDGGFKAGPLCKGLLLSLNITFWGFVLSLCWGLCLCLFQLCPWPGCRLFAVCFIGLFRGTPLLLQLFFVYFLVSPLLGLTPFLSALLALAAFESACFAEVFRGALQHIPRQQWEAGLALGFSLPQCLRLFILPQAVRHSLPAIVNQTIAVLKDSSLVSAIAVADLTMQAQAIVAETFLAFEVWLAVAFIYLGLASIFAFLGLIMERRSRWAMLR